MPPLSYREFTRSIIETLEMLDIEYAIGGSFASSVYGEARTTIDIDISIVLPLAGASGFVEAIQRLGYYVFLDSIVGRIACRVSPPHRENLIGAGSPRP